MQFTETGLARLEADLKANVAKGQPPGLVALVARGDQTHIWPVGGMTLSGQPPVARDTIFRIASMTKPITAVAAWMLIEEGKLKLDEPIDRLAPELANRRVLKRMDGPLDDTVPAARPITLEDVLSFRLGWGIDFNPDAPFVKATADLPGFGMPNPSAPYTPDSWMKAMGALPLQAQPGERWLYTAGANVLGVLVARAAGKPLETVFQERILGPLGMTDTAFYCPPEKASRLITGYMNDNGKLVPFAPYNDMFLKAPRFPAGDSGLVSTAEDFGGFAKFLFSGLAPDGKRLLSEASLKAMTTNCLTPAQMKDGEMILGSGRGWGLGLGVQVAASPYGVQPGAFGWDGGFGTSWFNDPAKGLTAIMLTQRVFDSPDPPSAHKDFWRDAYGAVG
ncbi:MAG: beta-lactamase family protein [Alphaproteobacteria bacterium]|nr:beta-lactamase family protein [Alphaproteobacteria bacterium]MBU1515994.1 beta-lactamase family protein [Alphaproteobacteria bacterium]MBU2092791.1 beta-lactamase family protein [Alphaproteobacteria bacterium]MBU2153684.1 beta-lactamase family protein [Alphaproteobacteria bacterium]MBU2308312.1 beta-lactamase family protein [Alphaproteobacteria bacterium]